MTKSCRAKVIGGILAGPAVLNNLVADLLSVRERTHTCALYGRDVNENVRAAVIRLDEAKALGGIEPFYSASIHNDVLS